MAAGDKEPVKVQSPEAAVNPLLTLKQTGQQQQTGSDNLDHKVGTPSFCLDQMLSSMHAQKLSHGKSWKLSGPFLSSTLCHFADVKPPTAGNQCFKSRVVRETLLAGAQGHGCCQGNLAAVPAKPGSYG